MGLGTQLAEQGGNSVENLRKRQQDMQGGGEKPAPAKKREAKPNGKANGKGKVEAAPKSDKLNRKAVKTKPEKTAKPKAEKPKAEKRTRSARPESVKMEGRSLDRDRKGDGLRDVERSVLKIVEKAGDISILNLAGKLYKKDPSEIPSEGVDSIRVVRNAVRRPIEMGLMEWAGRGTVKVTKAFSKDGMKIAERYVEKTRKAQSAKRAEKADKPKAGKGKKAEKSAKPAKSKKTGKTNKS